MRIIDLHTHLGKWFFPIEKVTVHDFLRVMERNGIETSVISSSRAVFHDFRIGNRELADAIQTDKRLLGFLFLNPNYLEESLQEMDRYMGQEEFVGLGELYHKGYIGDQTIDSYGHMRILERLLERFPQRLVLFHCFGEGFEALAKVATRFPQITFIAGHMGGPEFEPAIECLREVDNVYLEICSSSPVSGKIETAVQKVGAGRVVFGSDSTLLNPAFIIGTVVDSRISDGEKEQILYQNGRRLLAASEVASRNAAPHGA
jgi:hypothetical protein